MIGKLGGLLKGRALLYVVGVLGVIILGLLGTVYVQEKVSDYKDFQIQQLELDIKEAELDILIKSAEARSEIHTEVTNEDINKTLNSKRLFTGSARL